MTRVLNFFCIDLGGLLVVYIGSYGYVDKTIAS